MKKTITTVLATALLLISGNYLISTDEVIVPKATILGTSIGLKDIKDTKDGCTKTSNGITCNYYITSVQPNNTPDGIIYEIVNTMHTSKVSADWFNDCRTTETAIDCRAMAKTMITDDIANTKQQELDRYNEIKEMLQKQKDLSDGITKFNTELYSNDLN